MVISSTRGKSLGTLLGANAKNHTASAIIQPVDNWTNFGSIPAKESTDVEFAIAVIRSKYAGADFVDTKESPKTETRDSVMNNVSEKRAAGRLANWNLALSILALLFTAIFSTIGYFSTKQLITLTSNTTQLTATAVRNSDISLTLSNLTSATAFNSYITTSQKQASLNEPALILPNVKGGYELTPDGKTILIKTNLWQDVASAVKEQPGASTNDIILSLGVDRLYNEATNEKVTINELVGVVAAQIEQSR